MDQLVATISSSFASSFDGGESTSNNYPATKNEVEEEGVGYEIIIDNVGHVCKVQEEHGRQQNQPNTNSSGSSLPDYDSLVSIVKNLHTSLLDVLTLSTCDTTAVGGCTQLVNVDDERSCGAGGPSWVANFEIPCVVRVTRKKKKIDIEEWTRLRRAVQKRGRGDDDNDRPKGRTAFTSELDLYLFNQESIQWCESSDVDDDDDDDDTVPRMIDVKSSCRRRSDFSARPLSEEFVVLQ